MDLQDTETVSTSYGDVPIPAAEQETSPQAEQPNPGQGETQPEVPWWKQHENSEMEFTARGQQIKAPFSKVRQWAQQGYDYAQRMQAFNQEKEAFAARMAEFEKDAEWKEHVEYAKKDPQWAQDFHTWREQRQTWQQQNADNPFAQELNRVKQEIEPLKKMASDLEEQKVRIEREQQDKALETEVASIKERYSKIGMDLEAIDPDSGMTYEYNVLKYGSENGIKSFKTAFLELYGDRVESLREEAFKKQAADELAKRQKEGFIGRSSTPTQAPSRAKNVSQRSYGSLAEEALNDIRSGKY